MRGGPCSDTGTPLSPFPRPCCLFIGIANRVVTLAKQPYMRGGLHTAKRRECGKQKSRCEQVCTHHLFSIDSGTTVSPLNPTRLNWFIFQGDYFQERSTLLPLHGTTTDHGYSLKADAAFCFPCRQFKVNTSSSGASFIKGYTLKKWRTPVSTQCLRFIKY